MHTQRPRVRRLVGIGLASGALGTAVSAVIYIFGRAAGVTYVVRNAAAGPESIHVTDVVTFALMSIAAGLVVAVVVSRLRRPRLGVLEVVAASIAVLSTAMDLPIESAAPAKALLASMHLVVGAAFVLGLRIAQRNHTTAPAARAMTPAPALAA